MICTLGGYGGIATIPSVVSGSSPTWSWDLILEAEILTLEAEIWALKLRFESQGGGGRTHGRTNERTNERKSPCVLQDIVPFGAAAQKSHHLVY